LGKRIPEVHLDVGAFDDAERVVARSWIEILGEEGPHLAAVFT
jgi:hypothetical protein